MKTPTCEKDINRIYDASVYSKLSILPLVSRWNTYVQYIRDVSFCKKSMNAKKNELGNCKYITDSITYYIYIFLKMAKDSIMQSFKLKFILFIIHYTGSNVLSVLAPCEKITKLESFLCQGYSKMHITRNYNWVSLYGTILLCR